ncbi:MAG: hypothetical protein H8Z69_00880 [Nanohaloarchaea archaeon]|nr:hypothetical protein [Candidatus Nanohaloarchaea archaeon]
MQTRALPNTDEHEEENQKQIHSYDPENNWERFDPSESWVSNEDLSTAAEYLDSMEAGVKPHEVFQKGDYVRLERAGERVVEGELHAVVEEMGSDRYFLEIDTSETLNSGLNRESYVIPFKLEASDFDISNDSRTEVYLNGSESEVARLEPGLENGMDSDVYTG